jgi:hypothetical protein
VHLVLGPLCADLSVDPPQEEGEQQHQNTQHRLVNVPAQPTNDQ